MIDSARKLLCLLLIASLTLLGQASAQQPPPPPSGAPIPAQITDAHTAFLSNAGGDPYFAFFSGGVDRAYNDLYSSLRQWARVSVVSSPQAADLILEIHSRSNPSTTGGADPTPIDTPELELRLLDPASHTTLWTLHSYLHGSLASQKGRDRSLDQAATVLFNQLRQLTGEPLTPVEAKAASRRPGPSRRSIVISLAVTAAVAVITLASILSRLHDEPGQPPNPTLHARPVLPSLARTAHPLASRFGAEELLRRRSLLRRRKPLRQQRVLRRRCLDSEPSCAGDIWTSTVILTAAKRSGETSHSPQPPQPPQELSGKL